MHKSIAQESFTVTFNEGNRLLKEGQLTEAIAAYRKASEIKPDNMIVHAKLANAMITMAQKTTQEAITRYQKAIAINPDQAPWWIYAGMGNALNQNEQIDEAIAAYQKAISLNPDLPFRVYKHLVKLLKYKGKDGEAATLLKSSKFGSIAKIWEALNQTNIESINEEFSHYPTEITYEEIAQYFEQTSQFKVINLDSFGKKENQSFLESAGLSLSYLKLNLTGLITQESVLQKVDQTQFQPSMVEEGYIYALCPSTGQIIRSNRSFSIRTSDAICYRFK